MKTIAGTIDACGLALEMHLHNLYVGTNSTSASFGLI